MRPHLSIGQRTALSFTTMILLVLVASGTGLLYAQSVETAVNATRDGAAQLQSVNGLQVSWLAVVATIDTMLLTRQTTLIEGQLSDEQGVFHQRLAALQAASIGTSRDVIARNTTIVGELASLGDELTVTVGDLSSMAQNGQWAQALTLRHTDLASLQRRLNENLDLLTTNIQTDVTESVARSADAQRTMRTYWLLIASLALVLGAAAGVLTTRSIRRPIAALVVTVRAFRGGDLTQRADATRRDELGTLAQAFNSMAEQLQGLIGNLEARVAERTRDIITVTKVSAQTADILDIPQLLRSVADLTKDNFGLYHAHIYLVDETGQTLSLAGGAGEIGQRLVTAGHRISLAHPHSLVAAAARSRGVVVVDDAWQVPDFLPNPLLPETRSELAVALVARNQLLGVLDVQSAVVGRFGPDIQGVMETLARQVAAALSNAQLYTLSERSSRYEHALSTITERIQGAVNMEEVLQVTARELGQALRVPRTAIALQLESAPAPQSQADDKHTASREWHVDTAPLA